MADDPKGSRNIVRFEPNERVDLPDMKSMQDNGRSESRMLLHNFVFGFGPTMGFPQPAGASPTEWRTISEGCTNPGIPMLAAGLPASTTNHWRGGLNSYFHVSTAGAPVITVKRNAQEDVGALGGGATATGTAGVELDSGEIEQGSAIGCEGDDSQSQDMTGKPAGDYGIWIKTTFDAGQAGTRLFWNANTSEEDTQSMDTRKVPGWNMEIQTVAGGAPSDGSIMIYVFEWDGAAISNPSYWQNLIFEGIYGNTDPYPWGSSWGQDSSVGSDGAGYRSNHRQNNGVKCWQEWSAALRSQLRDIIGDAEGTGYWGWWTQIPEAAGTGGALAGTRVDLTVCRDHIDDNVNPHGANTTIANLICDAITTHTTDTVDVLFSGGAGARIVDLTQDGTIVYDTSTNSTPKIKTGQVQFMPGLGSLTQSLNDCKSQDLSTTIFAAGRYNEMNNGTPSIVGDRFNLGAVTRHSTGAYTVVFKQAHPTGDYWPSVQVLSGGLGYVAVIESASMGTGGFGFLTFDAITGAQSDPGTGVNSGVVIQVLYGRS